MRIDYRTSGGFANLSLAHAVDTRDLPEAEATELERAVDESGLFELEEPSLQPGSGGPPDVIAYEITVEDGPRRKHLAVNDATAPEQLRPLLARLRKLALDARRS